MKSLIIRILENYLVKAELMVGTDVLKIPLSLVRCINKHPFPTLNEKKVVHEGCEERSDRWVMSAANIPSVNPLISTMTIAFALADGITAYLSTFV